MQVTGKYLQGLHKYAHTTSKTITLTKSKLCNICSFEEVSIVL